MHSAVTFSFFHSRIYVTFFYDTGDDSVVAVELETFLRLLQPKALAACCWLISVVSAAQKHPPHITPSFCCCLLSFPLSGSAGFSVITSSFCLVGCPELWPGERKVDQNQHQKWTNNNPEKVGLGACKRILESSLIKSAASALWTFLHHFVRLRRHLV